MRYSTAQKQVLLQILLSLTVLIGAYFRFSYLNWDEGFSFHPDERNIAAAVTRISFFDQLDPGFFAYGGLFIYLVRAGVEVLSLLTGDVKWLSDWGNISLVSRFWSALFSVLSIPLIYLLGKRLKSAWFGLVAAVLSAFSVGLIQYAHYGVTESLLVFWLLLLTLISQSVLARPGRWVHWLRLAVVSGLAVATKTSGVSFLLIPFATWILSIGKSSKKYMLLAGVVFVLLAGVVCVLVSPYNVLNWEKFRESMEYESGVVTGRLSVPYNLQFTGTTPYLYFLRSLPWLVGPVPFLLALLGLGWWLLAIIREKDGRRYLPLLVFGLVYFGYVGVWHTKFIRYLLPLLPMIIFSAALLLYRLRKIWVVMILGVSMLWPLSYMSVYENRQTRLLASEWIYLNLPAGSIILHEHWDDRVPVNLLGVEEKFEFEEVASYEPDKQVKFEKLAKQMQEADYYVISSRRVYGSIVRNPEKYPMMSDFYKKLFSDKLGYKLIKGFASYPRIGSWVINDDSVEETFQVYDHPVVYVFQKTVDFSAEKVADLGFEL